MHKLVWHKSTTHNTIKKVNSYVSLMRKMWLRLFLFNFSSPNEVAEWLLETKIVLFEPSSPEVENFD